MNQQTHTWIAIRAIALLEDEHKERNLVRLLKPHARKASVGAWIPDQTDAKRGGSKTENHVLKMLPYQGDQESRFTVGKERLLKEIGMSRKTAHFLREDESLEPEWWDTPYRAEVPKRGQHLANRAMGLATMLKDALLLGNQEIDRLIPGRVRFIKSVIEEARTQEEAAVLYFFMLSHFMADICMPCHCDGRKLAGYGRGLHRELEEHWSEGVGAKFEKKNLLRSGGAGRRRRMLADADEVLEEARKIDRQFGLRFAKHVPRLRPKHDVWLEAIYLCRASFAVASIIAHPSDYPYTDEGARAPFKEVFGGEKEGLLAEVDRVAMHDAVLNTAIAWKHVWHDVSK